MKCASMTGCRRRAIEGVIGIVVLVGSVRARDAATQPATPSMPGTNPDAAPEQVPAERTSPPVDQVAPTGITGDWFGLRPQLKDAGFTINGLVQNDLSKNLRGGADTASAPNRYLLDLNLLVSRPFGIDGAQAYVELQGHQGEDGSANAAGDVQGFDNIDAPPFVQFNQLWWRQSLAHDRAWAKVGKIEANSDFSVVEHGTEFLNSSFAYSPTMYPLATYPDTAGGGELFVQPGGPIYAGLGAFYANRQNTFLVLAGHPRLVERVDGGTFLIGELGARWDRALNDLPAHAAVGGWGHAGRFISYGSSPRAGTGADTTNGSGGAYALLDKTLWTDGAHRDLGTFLLGGWSDPSTNPMTLQLGGGVSVAGPLPGRPRDAAGLGVTWAQLGHTPGLHHASETSIEAFYKASLFRGTFLKPDLQYIVHPSGAFPDALVFTMRVELDL